MEGGPALPAASRRQALLLGAVLLITFLAYSGTMRFQFVYDDGAQIVYNPAVQSWKLVGRMFSEHVWSGQVGATPNFYRPVFLLWCLLNFTAFGLKAAWWHLTTVGLHLVATALVYRLARRLGGDDFVAALAALIFGLHPIHVESVAWISGVTDPLMAVFVLGSFLTYLAYRERRRWTALATSLVLYGLACLSKEPGIVLVALIAGHEWIAAAAGTKLRARIRGLMIPLAPYAAVAALYLAQRHAVLKAFGHAVVALPWYAVPLTWPELLWFYARKLVWPAGLSPFYDTPYVTRADVEHFWTPLAAVLAVAVLVWLCVRRLGGEAAPGERRSPRQMAWIALLWIMVPLLPVLDILSLEPHEMAHDRYLYLPCAGFAMLVAMAVRRLQMGEARVFGQPMARMAVVILLLALLGTGTAAQSVYWANDLLLYYRAVSIAPSSLSASRSLANALLQRGYYAEGIKIHEGLLRRDPNYWASYYSLGDAYYKQGRLPEAAAYMLRAAQLNPSHPQIFLYLGLLQLKLQQLPQAEGNVRTAIRMWPNTTGGNYVLGLVLEEEGKWSEAAEAFRRELALNADQPKVREELEKAEQHLK